MKLLIMDSSPFHVSSFLLGPNIFLSALFSNTFLSLCFSVLYMYDPIFMKFCLRDLHIMLLSLFEFRENKRREGRTFVMCISEIIFTAVPSDHIAF
jgi:hypothetical protein